MKIDTKTLNLLGLLLVVAVLGLGAVGIVIPLYEGVQSSQTELDSERERNNNLQMSLTALISAEARQDEIEANLEALRMRLPAGPETHSALQIIANALETSGASMSLHTIAESTQFVPRGEDAPTESAPETEPAKDVPDDPALLDDLPDGFAVAGQEPQGEVAPPQQQIEMTLTVHLAGDDVATTFLDGLDAGPRSVLVTSSVLSPGDFNGFPYSLEVHLTLFYYETAVQ